jgi:hypothetical protein
LSRQWKSSFFNTSNLKYFEILHQYYVFLLEQILRITTYKILPNTSSILRITTGPNTTYYYKAILQVLILRITSSILRISTGPNTTYYYICNTSQYFINTTYYYGPNTTYYYILDTAQYFINTTYYYKTKYYVLLQSYTVIFNTSKYFINTTYYYGTKYYVLLHFKYYTILHQYYVLLRTKYYVIPHTWILHNTTSILHQYYVNTTRILRLSKRGFKWVNTTKYYVAWKRSIDQYYIILRILPNTS